MESSGGDAGEPSRIQEEEEVKNLLFRPLVDRRTFLKGMMGMFGLSTLGVGKGVANTAKTEIVLERVPVSLLGLPEAFRGLKIAHLSDLHSSPIVSPEHLRQAADLAANENPDLVVLTGDYIGHQLKTAPSQQHEFDVEHVERMVEALSVLNPPMGIFAVLGNHDFWSGRKATASLIERFSRGLNVQWLRNRNVLLKRGGESIQLIGIDDLWSGTCSIERAFDGVVPGKTRILLSHNPDVNMEIRYNLNWDADLILSGHTHGGQVVLPFIGPPFSPGINDGRYVSGLVREGNRQTYVTRGVGHLVVPVRFNCPPEVTLIELV